MSTPLQTVEGLHLLAFDPRDLGLYAAALNADGSVMPTTAADALAASGASVVIDGPKFEICSGQPAGSNQVERYRLSGCDKLSYLHHDPAHGLTFAGASATLHRGAVLAVMNDGSVQFVAASDRASVATADVRVAVQGDPVLVVNGVAQAMVHTDSNDSIVWRVAVGVMRDGQLAFALGQATLGAFAQKLVAAGFVNAIYTDGGGSASMLLADGTRIGASENRRVASWLTVGAAGGSDATPLIVAGLIAAGVLYWATKRS